MNDPKGRHEEPDQQGARARAMLSVLEDLQAERQRLADEIEERRRLEEQARSIVSTALDAVVATDENGVIVDWNPQAETIFGWSREEALGRNIADIIIPPASRQDHLRGLRRFLTTGESHMLNRRLELTACHRSGEEFPVEVSLSAVSTARGWQFSAFLRDITEQKRAVMELNERDEKISSLLDSTAEGIFGLDLEGNCTFANRSSASLLSYESPNEFLGARMHDLIHHTRPDGSGYPNHQCRIYQSFRLGDPVHVDDEVLWKKDGTSFPSEYWSHPVRRDGRVVGSVVTFLDITERLKLKESQQQLNAELEQRVRMRTKELEEERRAAIRLAEEAEQARQRAEEAERRLASVASQLAMPPAEATESGKVGDRFSLRDFTLHDMITCGAAIRGLSVAHTTPTAYASAVVRYLYDRFLNDDGQPSFPLVRLFRTQCFGNLDTDQREFAQSLCSGIEEDTTCLTLLATVGSRAEWCEVSQSRGHRAIPLPGEEAIQRLPMIAGLLRQFGLPVSGVLQSTDIAPGDVESGTFHVRDAKDSPHVPSQHDFVLPYEIESVVGFGDLLPGGSLFVVIAFSKETVTQETASLFSHLSQSARLGLLSTLELENRTESQIRVVGRLLSNYERIVSEQESRLRRAVSDLARSNSDLQQFAYVASHDLQEPLRAVASYCQLLEHRHGERLDDEARLYIRHAVEGAERMRSLISALLEYSRIESQGVVPTPVPAAEAVERALLNLHDSIVKAGVRVRVDELPTVLADGSQLTRLFQNLISNSIKYRSEDTPEIIVSCKSKDDRWEFTIRDNGIGIEAKYAERIFVIFQRLHTREAYSGTGIGLAICKRIVERHGGHIWLDADPGTGTVFHFTLPMNESKNA